MKPWIWFCYLLLVAIGYGLGSNFDVENLNSYLKGTGLGFGAALVVYMFLRVTRSHERFDLDPGGKFAAAWPVVASWGAGLGAGLLMR